MPNTRFVHVSAYEIAFLEVEYHILMRGGDFYPYHLSEEEIPFRSIARARDVDEARKILRALRLTLNPGNPLSHETKE